ncbi:PIR protein [Plasmodium vivax]|nr:PIR protein [Plasmodium vivax]
MTKQKAPLPEEKLEEAAKAVGLHKIHEEEFFKTLEKSTEFDNLCNGIDTKAGSKSTEAKKLCIDLIHRLEKLSKDNTSKYNDYCSYLRYWLYEKVGDIHTDKSANVDNLPFFKHLIEVWGKMNNGKLKIKCLPDKLTTPVKLSEIKNRIFSYIYFKNLEKIKTISPSKKEDDCTKYLTYLESFKPVHDRYNNAQCGSLLFLLSYDTDYFRCNPKHKLTSLMTELQKCKIGDKENLKAVVPGPDKSKGVAAAAPAKDQKVSGGTTELKAPVAVASSSSSSTVVTTSPAVTTPKAATLSTPATTTSTVVAAKPVTTTSTAAASSRVTTTTQAKTTSAGTTTNTVTTSSSSQRRSWIWPSFFSSSSSPRTSALGASQTSTSTSGSTVSARQVTTTSTSGGRGSPVTVTTDTRSAAGSISSTGQGLAHPLATGVGNGKSLTSPSQGSPGHALNPVSSYNSNTRGDPSLATITDIPGTSETLYDKLDSNTVKNIVMAAAVLGIIFFLFYYNRSSRIESSIKPKKRKKKAFEHNYYEEYEKELAKYESDNESLDSLDDRYYLTYQPDQDSHY